MEIYTVTYVSKGWTKRVNWTLAEDERAFPVTQDRDLSRQQKNTEDAQGKLGKFWVFGMSLYGGARLRDMRQALARVLLPKESIQIKNE